MSLVKRIWVEGDPSYENVRRRYADDVWRDMEQFKFRAPCKRRIKGAKSPHWDPFWTISLNRAVKQLGFKTYIVNNGMLFRTEGQRDSAVTLAETLWRQQIKQRVGDSRHSEQ